MNALILLLATILAFTAAPTRAAPGITTQQIQFKKGETGVSIKGTITGDQIIDYRLNADAGQAMVVKLSPSNPSAYFNVLPPASAEAIHIGSSAGNSFSTYLKASGEYTIRVYLMRNAARRNERADYTLDIGVSGELKRTNSAPGAADATVVGSAAPFKWDASGSVRCSVVSDQFDRQCGFRVVRDQSQKTADIWIANVSEDRAGYRHLRYAEKAFTGDDKAKISWKRKGDNWWLNVDGKEFYLIPDALVHGG